ncbi:F-box protein At2g21930-like [Apium graveolens]|uniref:F-box protein At2g21930-like n=1 Tax=Apium graveolens TaxID=4045 RepID=UPI003D7A2C7D
MASSKDARHRTDTTWSEQALTCCIYIPDDLIINILQRLPVKTLLRFKTVSKRWLSLISDPSFVYSHLRHASENNESLIFNIKRYYHYKYSIALRHIDSTVDLPYFEGELLRDLYIIGSSNGIVCLVKNYRADLVSYRNHLHRASGIYETRSLNLQIYLWNPATKKSKLLPPPHCLVTNFAFEQVGFGFDPLVNDYKVVMCHYHLNRDTCAVVYSTNANAWKEIERPKIYPQLSVCDACVNGVLYWSSYHCVMLYDLNKEVFYDHRFPANVLRTSGGKLLCVRIMEMKDSIAVITYTNDVARLQSKVNLWTVDDGFERSWTLRYSFDVASAVDGIHNYLNNNGDILLRTRDGGWYN